MIPLPPSTRIFLACGATDMRKGFDGLAVMVQQVLTLSPHSGALFAFRGKRGDLVKLLWFDGQGLWLTLSIRLLLDKTIALPAQDGTSLPVPGKASQASFSIFGLSNLFCLSQERGGCPCIGRFR
jgi:hypothetical protein